MRSEELAALAGDIRPVDLGAIHNRARDEVVSKGRATGKEHGVAVFADGTMVSFGGDHENRIDVPRFDVPSGSVTIHHNHPGGDSFSRADIRILLERSELGRVDAHGHAGGWASCERLGDALSPMAAFSTVEDAASQANLLTRNAFNRQKISHKEAGAGLLYVVAAILLEKRGVIRYALNSQSVLNLARKVIEP